jgi:hypothetical protein
MLGKEMIGPRLVVLGVLAGLAGYAAPVKAEPVSLRCEKFQDSSTGVPVMFVKVDFEKNEFHIKSYYDESWKVIKDAKLADDIIQVQEKRWVDRSTGVLKWDFATYQCQTTRAKAF